MKVTPQQVLETLEESEDHVTISELANIFDVTPETIRTKLRKLRGDGEPIIHDGDGIFLITKSNLEDVEVANEFAAWMSWYLSIVKALAGIGGSVRPLFPVMKRTLIQNTSHEERRKIASMCLRIKALVDHIEAYEEQESL